MAGLFSVSSTQSLQRTDTEFKIFQFPHDMIPRIDGNIDGWAMVAVDADRSRGAKHLQPANR